MNHVCEAHSDIEYLATLTAPVLIRIRCTDDGTTHDHAILTLASANHIETIANVGFLIIPDAPVVVESLIKEILHRILKLRQFVVADISIPAHDKGLTEVFTDNTLCPIKQIVPLFIIHFIKQSLCFIQKPEFILFLHQTAEILKLHHLTGVALHHTHILANTNKHVIRIVNHSDCAQFLFLSNMTLLFPDVDCLQIRPLNIDEVLKGFLNFVLCFVPSDISSRIKVEVPICTGNDKFLTSIDNVVQILTPQMPLLFGISLCQFYAFIFLIYDSASPVYLLNSIKIGIA